MKVFSNVVATVLFLLLLATPGSATNHRQLHRTLATAKMAGACGILDSMINFQKTTRMQGGDEFVSRFWAVEATRLGMSVEELSDQCDDAILRYQELWNHSADS